MSAVKKFAAFLAALLIFLSASGVAFADNRETVVYVTDTGTMYHTWDCSYLRKSCNSCTLEWAASRGYTACSRCQPPLPDFPVTATPIPIYESSSSSNSNYRATPSTPYRRSPSTTDVPHKQLEERWMPTMREIMICIALTTIINWWIFAAKRRKWRQSDLEKLSREQDDFKRRLKLDWEYKEADLKRQINLLEENQRRREKELYTEAENRLHSKVLEAQAEATRTTVAGMLSLIPCGHGITLPSPPPGSCIAADGLPSSKGSGKWGDKYTFYTSQNGKVFHCRLCSSMTFWGTEINAFHLLNNKRYRPCKICMPKLPDMSWYEEYLKAIKEVSETFPNRPQ